MKVMLVTRPGPVSIPPKVFDAGIDRKTNSKGCRSQRGGGITAQLGASPPSPLESAGNPTYRWAINAHKVLV